MIKKTIKYAASALGIHNWPARCSKLQILAYHRVLPHDDDRFQLEQPGMCVTPQTLEKNIEWLSKNFTIVKLSDWLNKQSGTASNGNYCALTFDDGWVDNLEFALPILKKYQVPATVFCVPSLISSESQYWPGRLQNLLLACDKDERLRQNARSSLDWLYRVIMDAGDVFPLSPDSIDNIVEACKASYSDSEVKEYIDATVTNLGFIENLERQFMNKQELLLMIQSGLIDIGSHTMTHLRLDKCSDPALLLEEIVRSKKELKEMFDLPVDVFCYPNGCVTRESQDLVGRNYLGGCGLERGWNYRSDDYSALTRINVHESIGSTRIEFLSRLSGWF